MWAGNRAFTPPEPNLALTVPTIAFRLGIYDKLRGAYIHEGPSLPLHFTAGQLFGNREMPGVLAFEANTEIEPRLFVDEIRWGEALATPDALEAARLRTYVVLTFMGYLEQNDNEPSDGGR